MGELQIIKEQIINIINNIDDEEVAYYILGLMQGLLEDK